MIDISYTSSEYRFDIYGFDNITGQLISSQLTSSGYYTVTHAGNFPVLVPLSDDTLGLESGVFLDDGTLVLSKKAPGVSYFVSYIKPL